MQGFGNRCGLTAVACVMLGGWLAGCAPRPGATPAGWFLFALVSEIWYYFFFKAIRSGT